MFYIHKSEILDLFQCLPPGSHPQGSKTVTELFVFNQGCYREESMMPIQAAYTD